MSDGAYSKLDVCLRRQLKWCECEEQVYQFYEMFPCAIKLCLKNGQKSLFQSFDFFEYVVLQEKFDKESIKFAKHLDSIAYRDMKPPIGNIFFRCFEHMSNSLQDNVKPLIRKWWMREGMREDVAALSQSDIDLSKIFCTQTLIPNDIYLVFEKKKFPIPTLFVFREHENINRRTCVCSSCLQDCDKMKAIDTKLFSIMFQDTIDDCVISQLLSNICVGICVKAEFIGLAELFRSAKVDFHTLINDWLTTHISGCVMINACEWLFEKHSGDILSNKFLGDTIKPCAVKYLRVTDIYDVHFVSQVFLKDSICLQMNQNVLIVFDKSISGKYLNEIFQPLWKLMLTNKELSESDIVDAKGFTYVEKIQHILDKACISNSNDMMKHMSCLRESAEKYLNADERLQAAEMLLHELSNPSQIERLRNKRRQKKLRKKNARHAAACEIKVEKEDEEKKEKEDEENIIKALQNKRRLLNMRKMFKRNRVVCELSSFLRSHNIWKLRLELVEKKQTALQTQLDALFHELVCPISHEMFVDPVVACDGNTYERQFISDWLLVNSTSPLFGENMNDHLVQNTLVKKMAALVS